MKQLIAWVLANPDAVETVVKYIFWGVGYLIAAGVIKQKWVLFAYQFSVAAAEQWKKVKEKNGDKVEPSAVRDKAIEYIKGRLGTSVPIDFDLLEGMVFAVTNKPTVATPTTELPVPEKKTE